MVAARGWGNGELLFHGYRLSMWEDENHSGDGDAGGTTV